MAYDWIKMRNDLRDDPDVIAIAARTGLDEYAVVGRLHAIWSWADAHTTDGHAPGVTPAWLDRYVHADGFAAAMVSVGWLEPDGDGIAFPRFDRHNTQTGKQRALAANRQAKQREKRHATSHAHSVTKSAPTQHNTTQETSSPSAPSAPVADDWEEVEEMLADRGVGRAREAVTSARNRGATRDAVLAIVAEYDQQPRRYGPGALKDRVAGDLAHWPPPNAETVRVDEAAAQEARLRREREETQRRRQQQEAEAEERKSLERDYGPRLAAMSAEEIRSLAFAAMDPAAATATLQRYRRDRLARADLLRAVRDRSPPAPALAG